MGRRSWERKIGKRGRRKKEERNKEKGEKIGRRRRGEGEGLGTWGRLHARHACMHGVAGLFCFFFFEKKNKQTAATKRNKKKTKQNRKNIFS